ncbi:hypothetical protein EYZ11_011262 [Aspergillus tanneri]|uniref:FAD-binding PCMH-type domain-containing protein n=1 Tax=Aspergillus tanneri TaxID=1220188 RepID=A0A4S3J5E1_9EURO|nr:uncharacterized protein ATNIH1004_008175 [Aspergillus tanneri]KAA8643979.1 hypothetical protein ATNIH1004_008175 [Aspergillus tanneri]THC89287.1 hypothetical protein EYZ11_011262 [Aspergillus tanneri]
MPSPWKFLGAYLAVCSSSLVQAKSISLESKNFDIATALDSHGIDSSIIQSQGSGTIQSTEVGCQDACTRLESRFGPGKVLTPNTTAYSNFTQSFWSAHQEVQPSCIFTPAVNTDVSAVVLLSRLTRCPFAARSGGHAAFKGASNSPGGITIWFKDMNEVTLSEDKSVASIGPGNVWDSVYKALQPHGLAVIGGRASGIGVGGLITGGGISFYSNLYGWALDNVQSFEVVTANGDIVTASETQLPDLYWGLRGGGNNLGLVTKFNLYTIPSPMMRGGTRIFTQGQFGPVIKAFVDIVHESPADGNAQYYVAFIRRDGINMAAAELTYAKNETDPPIYRQIRSIPSIADTTTSKDLVKYCKDIDVQNPNGLREIYWSISAYLNEEFAKWTCDYYFSVLHQTDGVKGGYPVLVYQFLTEPILKNMTNYGGNALGLDASKGPIHLLQISFWWEDAADDDKVYKFLNDFWNAVSAKAKSMGVYNKWIYMNYASQFQDVIASYGETNKARLKQIAVKYDPDGIFQTLQPGYFKLSRAPVVNPY